MSFRVQLGLGELQKDLLRIGDAGSRIMARALDRAATSGKTAMARSIAGETGIANRAVTKQIRIDKAGLRSKTNPRITVSISGGKIPLIAFGARGPEPSRGRGRGVTTKLPSQRVVPHGFIATMPGGHRGVFVRSRYGKKGIRFNAKKREVIEELFGPSLPSVFEKFIPTVFQSAAQQSLTKNLIHELGRELDKQAGA